MRLRILVVLCTFFTIASCSSNPGVLQLSENTFVVSKSSAAGAFTNMAKLRASTIQEANQYAAKQGKIAVAISDRETVPTSGFPSYEYQFMLVDKGDSRATGATLGKRAEKVSENTQKIEYTDNTQAIEEDGDLYTELLKLDDLLKKGIITQQEFDTQKARILNK